MTIDPDSYDGRMGRLILWLAEQQGEGYTSAQVAKALGWERPEAAAKLRSLAHHGLLESTSDWERPARYWVRWPIGEALRLVGALSLSSRGEAPR